MAEPLPIDARQVPKAEGQGPTPKGQGPTGPTARAIEASTFAIGAHNQAAPTGHPAVDEAFSQARTWAEQAHDLHLLTIYEQRIRRAVNKNMSQLKVFQAERKEAAKEAMNQAKMLYELAQAQGKPYKPEAYFVAAPQLTESVFSTPEIAREINRAQLLKDAETYHYRDELPKKEAIICA